VRTISLNIRSDFILAHDSVQPAASLISLTSAASALSFIPIGNKITRRGSSTENRPAAKSFRI